MVVAAINVAVPSAEYGNRQLVDRLLGPLLASCREVSLRLGAAR